MDAEASAAAYAKLLGVSIHAPVMDADTLNYAWDRGVSVSIHAPVMDAKVRLC